MAKFGYIGLMIVTAINVSQSLSQLFITYYNAQEAYFLEAISD